MIGQSCPCRPKLLSRLLFRSGLFLWFDLEGLFVLGLDWRDDIDQIYELLESSLSPEHYALLPERTTISALTLGKKVLELSRYLEKSGKALRLIESLGDSYYLIIVPINLVAKFDDIAKRRAVDAD